MPRRQALVFVLIAGAVVALDQVTKAMVRSSFEIGQSVPVVDGLLWLTRVRNTGAAFGLFRGWQWLLVGIAFVVLAAVAWVFAHLRPQSAMARAALALISGGAIGNLIDRALMGGVTDFIDLGWFPVFNVADIALDTGVALLVVWLLFGAEHRATDAAERPHGSPDAAADPGAGDGEAAV